MGRNRKWVLQDDIQEAVWRTILRGPRLPSNKWEMRNKSDASKPHSKVVKGEPKKDPQVPKKSQVQAKAQSVQKPKPCEAMSPDRHGGSPCQSGQVAGCPYHFGRGRRDVPHNSGSSEAGRIESPGTPSFRAHPIDEVVRRKETEEGGTSQGDSGTSQGGTCCCVRRSRTTGSSSRRWGTEVGRTSRRGKSPLLRRSRCFRHTPKIPEVMELQRLQDTILGLQRELAKLRAGQSLRTHRDGRRRRRYGGGTSTEEVQVGAVHTFGHHIRPCPGSWNTVEMSEDPALCIMRTDVHRRVTRYGMRGKRVGEASNPGPRYFLRRRQTVVDVSSDSNGEGGESAIGVANTIENPLTSLSHPNANRFTPLALPSDDDEDPPVSRPSRRRRLVLRQSRHSVHRDAH